MLRVSVGVIPTHTFFDLSRFYVLKSFLPYCQSGVSEVVTDPRATTYTSTREWGPDGRHLPLSGRVTEPVLDPESKELTV